MKAWYFTLGTGQGGPGCVQVWANDWHDARARMHRRFGDRWAFQYDSHDKVHPLDQLILFELSAEDE